MLFNESVKRFYIILRWKCKNNLLLLIFFISLFSSSIGYIFYLKPLLINKKNISMRLNDLNVLLLEKKKILAKYVVNSSKLALLKSQFFFCPHNVEKYDKNKTLLALLSGQMLPEALKINYLHAGINQNETAFVKLPVKVGVKSNKKNIEEFLYQIANFKYPLLINNFKWDFFDFLSARSKGKLTVLFVLYLENAAPENFFSLPVHNGYVSINYSDKEILTHYALNEIKMVGFLSQFPKKVWALIQFPNKKIQKAELNDKLGLEEGRIIRIGAKKIVIQEGSNDKSIELSIANKDL